MPGCAAARLLTEGVQPGCPIVTVLGGGPRARPATSAPSWPG
jgi:hypothetical protein